jgi:hypothetical protein
MPEIIITINALVRVGIMLFLIQHSIRFKDWLAITICFLYGLAIFAARVLHWNADLVTTLSTPVAFLMAFYIVRSQRLIHNLSKGTKSEEN